MGWVNQLFILVSEPIPDIAEIQTLKAFGGPVDPHPHFSTLFLCRLSPQGLKGMSENATQRPARAISQGQSLMVPMETLLFASKETSLVMTLELVPPFQHPLPPPACL